MCYSFVYFFFFKQKTAYEMRISDWSSDVCSSDLILGHSMGGHGALTIALSFPSRFKAVSAFAPIVAPSQVPWGQKALGGYLGADQAAWRRHDSVALIEDGARVPALLVDQGEADSFLEKQLRPELLQGACERAGIE